jgi:hypothetical protein
MPSTITETAIPTQSRLYANAQYNYFHDTFEIEIADGKSSPLALMLQAFARTPAWVDGLMKLRNRIVSLCGIKDVGALSNIDPNKPVESYRVGDRVGVFTIDSLTDNEVVFSDSDKHLNAQISVYRYDSGTPRIAVTTAVQVHNLLGRAYLLFVIPVHKRVVPAILRGAVAS